MPYQEGLTTPQTGAPGPGFYAANDYFVAETRVFEVHYTWVLRSTYSALAKTSLAPSRQGSRWTDSRAEDCDEESATRVSGLYPTFSRFRLSRQVQATTQCLQRLQPTLPDLPATRATVAWQPGNAA